MRIFYLFLPSYGKESIVLWSIFQKGELDVFTYFEAPSIGKNHILSRRFLYVSVSIIGITQKQVIAETTN